ncbi:MAG: hypothetical protein EZS28_016671 [Streblomastix strix]|uniref:Uncharacterized protein n=1 Tax=Streblomastix strix TaxID=222440 RepID=A0A5J4VYQ4_9EUKA|nr:MAG: hypothetical protein EZS28_016671 [Streblomastix strix]
MSCAGGEGNDFDNSCSLAQYDLSVILQQLSTLRRDEDQQAFQIQESVNESVESEGLIEEGSALVFNTDTRISCGVKEQAQKLVMILQSLTQISRFWLLDDPSDI